MTQLASGPEAVDWLAGLLRGFHPLRWLLCLAGLVLTGLSAAAAQSLFEGEPRWLDWWWQPVERAQALWDEIANRSLGGSVVRGGPLVALNAALWCLIGGWLARHELVARRRVRTDLTGERTQPGPTALLVGWWKPLLACCPTVLLLTIMLLLPVLVAGQVNAWLGGFGALLVSVSLPVLLGADLVVLALAFGALAWPLMAVAVAAECGDHFDALSRSHSYAFQRPLRFLLLTGTALALAGLPVWMVGYALADMMAAWQPEVRQTVFWLAAALAASIFWSLETLVYLHLRAAFDGVDAGEVAVEPLPDGKPTAPSPTAAVSRASGPGDAGPAAQPSFVANTLLCLALVVGSWCLTYWLLARASGEPTAWLGWGLGETLIPPADGIYRVASWVAAVWGVVWLGLPVVWAVRRLLRGEPPRRDKLLPAKQP